VLDSETKRRIDTARDILVGKVPDPKSQVEQITIALIYKFMDDMDQESISMGGKASFFIGDYENYSWSNIFNPRYSGFEMLNLYADALLKMGQNPHLPQLFRDIFKNAFLPYRDPETLKLFLKTIDDFSYDQSERLGDAFEYLLLVLGSQGDAGQFLTPRHIINFMIQGVKPQKTESILDPACGTAGFLISAYRYILNQNSTNPVTGYSNGWTGKGDLLTPQERTDLMQNFQGYDISPDMVRLSRVNLYLHGFPQPQIYEYDTLTSEERWNDFADVIFANPPFMSPKGGIKPHKRFGVQSNRSEVLFVDYIADHLKPAGRAAVIVPEGIIFQSGNAYKQLRKYLIDRELLWAVVSLPTGVFNPYSGVKTSILFMDRTLARATDKVLFLKISADGFDLGAQRRLNEKNDLPTALQLLESWQQQVREGKGKELSFSAPISSITLPLLVTKSHLAKDGDFNLSADRYRERIIDVNQEYLLVDLGDDRFFSIESGGTPDSKNEKYWGGEICWSTLVDLPATDFISNIWDTQRKLTITGLKNSSAVILPVDSILVSSRATIGRIGINKIPIATNQGFKNIIIRDKNAANPMFVALMVKMLVPKMIRLSSGGTFKEISKTNFSTLQIPLPPIETQRAIVAEIVGYQKIIDGAKQVVDSWKPNIEVELEEARKTAGFDTWKMVKVGDICLVKGGKRLPKGLQFAKEKTDHPYIRVTDMIEGSINSDDLKYISQDVHSKINNYTISKNDVYISIAGTIGLFGTLPEKLDGTNLTENAAKLVLDIKQLDKNYLKYIGNSYLVQQQVKRLTHSVGVPKLALERIRTIEFPLPPLETQQKIVTHIETERQLIEGNRQLIATYEEKIKKVISRVWEG
jgi:type I restriction enzyme M protein